MSTPLKDYEREVIPRWRDLRTTILVGELTPSRTDVAVSAVDDRFLKDKIFDWEAERSLPYANEVVGAALVLGEPAQAREAAQYVIFHAGAAAQAAVHLAQRVLSESREQPKLAPGDKDSFAVTIREMKALVRSDPRNAFAWVELARAYASLGLRERAMQGIKIALSLGGNNRHILRSAARLYTHFGEPARAHRVLSSAESTPYDPWLIAAEIGTAGLCDAPPKFVREGLRLLDSRRISPFDLTELASAVATLDSKAGNHRLARKHWRRALQDPNDNTVAQARWAATQKLIDLDPALLRLRRAYEARSWYAFYAGNWHASLEAGKRWLRDQPFSASPAIHSSYVAAVGLEDHQESIRIAQAGLLANPNDVKLLNNLSYSLASLGRLREAEAALTRIDRSALPKAGIVFIIATAGLIAYRAGDSALGRRLYESAVGTAAACGDKRLQATAAVFFALEALRAQSESATTVAEKALQLGSEFRDVGFDLLRSRLERAIRERQAIYP